MKKIEVELQELFRDPLMLTLVLNELNSEQLYQLIGASFIMMLKHSTNGKDIEFNKPDEIKQALNKIWKKVEKDLISSYNICGK